MIVNVFGYAEKLEKSGFTKSQAEASLQVLVEIMNQEFATKEDMRMLSQQVHSEVEMLRREHHSDMEKMSDKLTIRMGGMIMAGFSLMFALLQIYK